MAHSVLITGGAGFIGSHLCDELVSRGYRVRVLDSLAPQVHGDEGVTPGYLTTDAELLLGDVRDKDTIRRALDGIDAVYHLAAAVGVGQSMYEIARYVSANDLGTAVLLEALIERPVERLVVASSMSIYGEGLYRAADGTLVAGHARPLEQLKAGAWELCGPDGQPLTPVPTPETKTPSLASVYALSKYDQERLCLMIGQAYDIPTVALRLFNVYGTRQALSNPYTGVLAIFASRLLNDHPPLIYEDGYQQRDFVNVRDVVQALRLAMEAPKGPGHTFNVGSGEPHSVLEVAQSMAEVLGRPWLQPEVSGRYRVGDIRHCFADIGLAQQVLGYQPQVPFARGLAELADWLQGQSAHDRVAEAQRELSARGLTV